MEGNNVSSNQKNKVVQYMRCVRVCTVVVGAYVVAGCPLSQKRRFLADLMADLSEEKRAQGANASAIRSNESNNPHTKL